MLPALDKKRIITLTVTVLAALMFPNNVKAAVGAPQVCEPGSTCKVGEFLYDDSYVLIEGAACTLTSTNPTGAAYLTAQPMTGSAGWYSYSFTAPVTLGLYPSQMCCTTGGQKMCLDKSFEIKAAAANTSADEVAGAVWGYSSRTLSSFGDLASSVWSSSSRTLSSFGTLISDMWGSSSNKTASQSAVADLQKSVNQANVLLDKVVNKPIIENVLEEDKTVDLQTKINDSKNISTRLFVNTQYLISKTSLLSSKWRMYDSQDLADSFDELNRLVGQSTDAQTQESIYGEVNWLKNQWGFPVTDQLLTQLGTIKGSLMAVQNSTGTLPVKNLKSLLSANRNLETLMGNSSDSTGEITLFSKLKEVKQLADAYNSKSSEINAVLTDWNKLTPLEKQKRIASLQKNLASINLLPKSKELVLGVSTVNPGEKELKNQLLSLRGVIDTNKLLLAKKPGIAFSNTWLEEGSIVFKSVITNPSSLSAQKVPLKYYLPVEAKAENIIEKSDGLTVEFDAEKNQYYIAGEYTLAAGETMTVSVRMTDVWQIGSDQVDSLRKQAEELAKPLEKTSYFAQGVTLKSDIDVSLDKVNILQSNAVTPEEKIQAYREATIEYNAAKDKTEKLKELATQAGTSGNLLGFVGGAQTLAVWGLIIIIVGGFIWLSISMKMIGNKKVAVAKVNKVAAQPRKFKINFPFVTTLVATTIISSLATGFVLPRFQKTASKTEATPTPGVENVQGAQTETAVGGGKDIVLIEVPEGSSVIAREAPVADAKITYHFDVATEVERVATSSGWVRVAQGWVSDKFIYSPQITSAKSQSVVIGDTTTGWLRVRKTPGGQEIGQVNSGEKYLYIKDENGWYEIDLTNGKAGWVSGRYASVVEEMK